MHAVRLWLSELGRQEFADQPDDRLGICIGAACSNSHDCSDDVRWTILALDESAAARQQSLRGGGES
jgi:hypothetical protein